MPTRLFFTAAILTARLAIVGYRAYHGNRRRRLR